MARLLGGSWVVISGVTGKVTIVITHIRGLITILTTTHEPPSRLQKFGLCELDVCWASVKELLETPAGKQVTVPASVPLNPKSLNP